MGGTRLRPIVPESKEGNWELMGPRQRVRWPGEAPVDVLHTLWDSGSLMPESGTIERLPLGTQEVATRGEKRT